MEYNRQLWQARANRKVEDVVVTLQELADIYMDQPIFLVTNKTIAPPSPNPNLREYFSLSDYYWPTRPSEVNPDGLPYSYNPSVNLGVYAITPNKVHMGLTIEEAATLALAYYFTGNLDYAQRARDKIYAWFLDPEAGMLPELRYAGMIRGQGNSGRPEGLQDLVRLPDLLNAAGLLEAAGAPPWTSRDSTLMTQWATAYADWLTNEPVARYARMAANYIGVNADEQLIAARIYVGDLDAAAAVAFYGRIRREDQIVDGILRYEIERRRSFDFTQACIVSWSNIAIMGEKLGLDLWSDGLGFGHSVKDAFDLLRPYMENFGETWPYQQVGDTDVRPSGQLVPRMYVAFRAAAADGGGPARDTGPAEYILLYSAIWPAFDTAGSQARAIVERGVAIELDTRFVEFGVPLIEECADLWCDTSTLIIWGFTLAAACLVSGCLIYNCLNHWRANRATEVPRYLRRIREQQARLKQMQLKVAPAKPEYIEGMKAAKEKAALEEELRRAEELKARQLRREIRDTEAKLARKRESKMQSKMANSVAASMYGGMYGAQSTYAPSQATSVASGSYFHDSFMPPGAAGAPPPPPGAPTMDAAAAGAYMPPPMMDAAPWQPRSLQGAAIEEEPLVPSRPPAGDFSFPVASGQPESPQAGLNTMGSYSGLSNPLSTGTGPSQSLTGILQNANALIGEMGTSSALTAAQSAAMLSRNSALSGGYTGGGTGSIAAPGRGGTPPLPPPPKSRSPGPSPR